MGKGSRFILLPVRNMSPRIYPISSPRLLFLHKKDLSNSLIDVEAGKAMTNVVESKPPSAISHTHGLECNPTFHQTPSTRRLDYFRSSYK